MFQQLVVFSATVATIASAYPFMNVPGAGMEALKRAAAVSPSQPRGAVFNADAQRISTTGAHAFVAPGAGDRRGPCPGLNALANHNYLPHNGVVTLQQAIDATNAGFGMGRDLGGFLSVYATIIDGDPTSQTWSIGGSPGGTLLNPLGLLHPPQGLSGSHNKYESDASPGRGDSFLNNGDASTLNKNNFQSLYGLQSGDAGGNYDLDILIQHAQKTIDFSRANNPQFFWGPFTGVVVSQAAFSFIPAFMSNHSAENPQGVLNQDILKSFFGVTGTQGNLVVNKGMERFPDNWYRRPNGFEYTIPAFIVDQQLILAAVPKRVAVGGNLGQAGKFAGVDVSDLTGGVYNSQNFLQGNNAICFAYQTLLSAVPDVLKGLVSDVTSAVGLLQNRVGPSFASLNCPQIKSYNKDLFNQYPGAGAAL